MMAPLITLLTDRLHQLHLQLGASHAPAIEPQDAEALHNLRVSLRQLHSLLRPLNHRLSKAADLDRWVKQSMKLTNPIRDREVLIQELVKQNQTALADAYTLKMQTQLQQVYQALPLQTIGEQLAVLPDYWAKKLSADESKHLAKHIRKAWHSKRQKLLKSIQQATPDKHRLRVLIKELRYNSESYAAILPKKARADTARLKQLQEILGSWHDTWVWLELAKTIPELEILTPIWQQDLVKQDQATDRALVKLKHDWTR